MATVNDFLNRTLRLAGVLEEGENASAEMINDALSACNDMLAEWSEHGIRINDGDLALTDTFPLDPSEARAVRYNLAVELAPEYERDPRPIVVAVANNTYRRLQRKFLTVNDMELDSMLQSNYYFDIINGAWRG